MGEHSDGPDQATQTLPAESSDSAASATDEAAPASSLDAGRPSAGDGEERTAHAVVEAVSYVEEAGRIDVDVAVPGTASDTISLPVPADAHLGERDRRLHEELFAQGSSLESLEGEYLPVVVEAGSDRSIRLRDPEAAEESWRARLPDAATDVVPFVEALSAVVAGVAILPLLAVAAGAVLVGGSGQFALAVAVGYLVAAGGLLARAVLRS